MNLGYLLVNIKCLCSKDKNETINTYYRKRGIKIGCDTHIFSYLSVSEPYLIEIGNGVTISTDVKFITHDASIGVLLGRKEVSDIVGKIVIGNQTFIGSGSIIMYGVEIGNRCIVAAGSVVTKSIPDGEIWGGNPAKYISTTQEYIDKNRGLGLPLHGLNFEMRKRVIIKSNMKSR